MSRNGRRAVFLDRDGTLNVEKDYLIDPVEFEFIPCVPQALKCLQDAGFLLVVVTNQSGVARGYFDLEDVDQLHEHVQKLLSEYDVKIDGFYICPHHPSKGDSPFTCECECRKGKSGLLLDAAEELEIDLKRSFMVGDKATDIDAGIAAGCQCVLVETGYGADYVYYAKQMHVEISKDLLGAANQILSC